jgi:ribosomal protein S6
MKEYELSFLLKEEDSAPVKMVLGKYNPTELFEGPLVKVNLAYPIKKQNQAFFGYFSFGLEPEKVIELDYELKLESLLLRHLLIKLPSFIMKEERRQTTPAPEWPIIKRREPKAEAPMLTNEDLEKLKEEISL